ncbi:MAG: PfkB family carbohydrate kinase [Pseudomonadota bacterium]
MIDTLPRSGVLCVGRLYCDLIFVDVPRLPTLGTETFAGGLEIHAGGGAYITSAWLASLGQSASLVSFLPPPPFREQIVDEISRAGVDLSLSAGMAEGQAPQLTVSISTKGDRAMLTHQPGPSIPDLTAQDLRSAGVHHVHIGELTTLMERPELVKAARDAGATVSLDCGWDDRVATKGVASLLGKIDVFLPNASEAEALRKAGVSLDGPGLTVIKCGADGATAAVGTRALRVRAPKVVNVDPTGAGDAFNAGFLVAWLAGQDTEACLKAGNAAGARAVSGCGGFPSKFAPELAEEIVTH